MDELFEPLRAGDRVALARAITLIESTAEHHRQRADALLKMLTPHTGGSFRIGISGLPGAGKSTFIEAFGGMLIERDKKIAVLAIDPSSTRSGGSILGDKTRMEKLAREPNAFIRPSPSSGTLGGVSRRTRESILLCEAAGFDVVVVETVGVGQNESTVRSMVDFFMLLTLTGGGDELQGIKRGVMELIDTLVVNKADGDNRKRAELFAAECNQMLHLMTPATRGWQTRVFTCSALERVGIDDIWQTIEQFFKQGFDQGFISERREAQLASWVDSMLVEKLINELERNEELALFKKTQLQALSAGEITVSEACTRILSSFMGK